METFSNDTIDTSTLPRFEEVNFTSLQPAYWKVVLINLVIFFVVLAAATAVAVFLNPVMQEYLLGIVATFFVLCGMITLFSRLSFSKKAYAFREHDVLFRSGIIATTTVVVPYNRIQHVALHEGLIPRNFGLAEIHIFTAGGNGSDLEVPGIAKDEAENIKQLLMGKIKKEL